MNNILAWNAAVVAVLMLSTWLLSLAVRNASIVDIVWGLGFILIAWTTWINASPDNRSLLLPVLTTIWGLRLSLYLAWRNHGRPEDFRYQSMRNHHGDRFWLVSLLTVFTLQGTVMWVVGLPIMTSESALPVSGWLVNIGVLIWFIGLFFETVGDWQLAKFRADPKNQGTVLDRGLWRYTRHPNYFGDFCVWWGVFVVALGCGAAPWSVVGPILMSILLVKVSGVSLLEKTLVNSRPGYSDYVRQTSSFFPLPRRNNQTQQ